MSDSKNMLWDYLVFIVFVIASTFVAIWPRICGTKEKTKADFVFATGKVSMFAMMLSIARGTLGVRSFLGYPSELFYKGSAMWETLYGMVLAYPIVCFVFVPVYFNLGITSVYQYLDLRFKSRLVRCLASGTYVVRQLLNQGVTVFTPCVALNTVIGIPYSASIIGISIVSIIFTILGGLKAAILGDVMQGLTMIALCFAMIIQGNIDGGGSGAVIEKNIDGGRLNFFNFDLNPALRVTTVSALFGQLFMSLSIFGCQQNFVQRYCSMDSQKKVTKTLMYNIPVITVLFSLSWVVGMVVYAVYAECDPRKSGYIEKYDEILPFFVEDRFNYMPGIMGLFMASLFNGALSLNVSNLNSLATVTFEDFIRPIPTLKGMKDKHQLLAIKIISVVYGFVIMGISFGVGMLEGVIESSLLVTSATSGPLLGVFILAMVIPCCNWKGAATGVIFGHLITLWVALGALTVDKPLAKELNTTTAGCSNSSFNPHSLKHVQPWPVSGSLEFTNPITNPPTYTDQLFNTTRAENTDPLTQIYSITYMYYSVIGCLVTVITGWIISLCTSDVESDLYDEKLIHPTARKLASYFPGPKRRFAERNSFKPVSRNGSSLPPATISLENKDSKSSACYSHDVSLESETYNTRL